MLPVRFRARTPTGTRIIMIRVKIIKPHKKYNVGETVYVTPNEAHGLLDGGFATKAKDMVSFEYVTRNTSTKVKNAKKKSNHRETTK